MKRSTFSLLFFIKRARLNKNGEASIEMRVTINGTRAEASTKRSILPEYWNKEKGRVLPKNRDCKSLNSHLDEIHHRIMSLYQDMVKNGDELNPKMLLNHFFGRTTTPKHTILSIFSEHNKKTTELSSLGKTAKGTAKRYETSYRHTEEFIKTCYSVDDMDITKIDHKFVADYDHFLRSKRNCSNNTTVKYLKNFRKIINQSIANGYIKNDPFASTKFSYEKVDPVFLEQHELDLVINKKFTNNRLTQVRDVFVFCCYTGLAFADVKKLSLGNLHRDNGGSNWIVINRQKTKTICHIPILDIAQNILNKYKSNPQLKNGLLLPVLSNQKYNSYIKEIMAICGINKSITSHSARHTAATTVMLSNNVKIENVAAILGHSDIRMTQHYARVLNKDILSDMKKINEILNTSQGSNI